MRLPCCQTAKDGKKYGTFNPGTASHIYRVDIKDNTFQIYVNGGLRLSVTDNTYTMGTGIGLWINNAQLVVTSFKVTAL